jgi:hypothetical protein
MSELTTTTNNDLLLLVEEESTDYFSQASEASSQTGPASKPLPYYTFIECKPSDSGYIEPVKPLRTEQGTQKNLLTNTARPKFQWRAMRGDIISLETGFELGTYGNKDPERGEKENQYFRCRTSKVEFVNPEGIVEQVVEGSLVHPAPIFSPTLNNKEWKEGDTTPRKLPHPDLNKQIKNSPITSVVYGKLDTEYAERMGIPAERKCSDCVLAGGNTVTAINGEGATQTWTCRTKGELLFLVREVAVLVEDDNDNSIDVDLSLQWFPIESFGLDYLEHPVVFRIPLNGSDLFNTVNQPSFSFNVDFLKDSHVPRNVMGLGKYVAALKNGKDTRRYNVRIPGVEAKPSPLLIQPTEIYIVKQAASKPLPGASVAPKATTIFLAAEDKRFSANKALLRAAHAWACKSYEEALAAGAFKATEVPYPSISQLGDDIYGIIPDLENADNTNSIKPAKATAPKEVSDTKSLGSISNLNVAISNRLKNKQPTA